MISRLAWDRAPGGGAGELVMGLARIGLGAFYPISDTRKESLSGGFAAVAAGHRNRANVR